MPNKIAKNTILLYIRMVLVMIINLFVVRVVFNALGASDYGIYNVIAGVVIVFQSVATVLATSTQRFYSFYIGKGLSTQLSNIYTASINLYGIFCIASFIIAETAGLWFVNTQLNFPSDRIFAVNWIYQLSILAFIFTVLQSPFTSIFLSFEDMDLFALLSFMDVVLKLILSLIIAHSDGDRLILYGVILAVIPFIDLLIYFMIGKRKYEACKYRKFKGKKLYREMLSFSGWHLFGSMAAVCMNQINNFLVNIFFGVVANASRAIAMQVNSAISAFSGNFIVAIRPPMVKAYAEQDYKKLNNLFALGNKAVFYLMVLMVVPIYFQIGPILKLWLDTSDFQTQLFCRLLLIYALIASLSNPISIIVQASGNLKNYFLFVEAFTFACPVLTFVLYKVGYPVQATFYAMILTIAAAHVVRILCLRKIYPYFECRRYIESFLIKGVLILIVDALIVKYCVDWLHINGIVSILISIAISIVVTGALGLGIGLSSAERPIVFGELKRLIQRKRS